MFLYITCRSHLHFFVAARSLQTTWSFSSPAFFSANQRRIPQWWCFEIDDGCTVTRRRSLSCDIFGFHACFWCQFARIGSNATHNAVVSARLVNVGLYCGTCRLWRTVMSGDTSCNLQVGNSWQFDVLSMIWKWKTNLIHWHHWSLKLIHES